MSIFGRLVGGAAQAGAQLANKYVDDQIATQRAQMMAELQRRTAGQVREDDDAFRNDPTRVQRDRDRRAEDVKADSVARRGERVADLTDPTLTTAEAAKAERDAADKRRRDVADIEAKTPAEAARSGLIADATAKATAKYREPKEGSKTMAAKMAEVESAIGRPLSQQEKEGMAGLGKTEEGFAKFRRSLVMEAVKAGTLSPDDAEAKIKGLEQSDGVTAGVAAARREGKAPEALAELRARGFKDDQLSRWFTPDELKTKKPESIVSGAMERAARTAPTGPIYGSPEDAARRTPQQSPNAVSSGLLPPPLFPQFQGR